jgi:hypothetical protein
LGLKKASKEDIFIYFLNIDDAFSLSGEKMKYFRKR